jgi:hypothetical protein
VKTRLGKVWPGKLGDKVTMEDGSIVWLPGQEVEGFPDVDAYIGQTFVISDEGWQAWLDETMAVKAEQVEGGYKLLVMDPLMMMAGDVEENRAQEMTTKVFAPLKQLARKHECAIMLVHHMRKGDPKQGNQRGGQMLLGSVANHAWAEDSLYFRLGRGGDIICEQESKNAPVPGFRVSGIRNKKWTPVVTVNKDGDSEREPDGVDGPVRKARDNGKARTGESSPPKTAKISAPMKALHELGPGSHKVRLVADTAGVVVPSVYQAFKRHELKGWVKKVGTEYELTPEGLAALS